MTLFSNYLPVAFFSITQVLLTNGRSIDEKLLDILLRHGKNPKDIKIAGHHLVGLDMLLPGDVDAGGSSGSESDERKKRKAVTPPNRLWPNGVVPYFISSKFDQEQRRRILEAMASIEAISCVVFRERTASEASYISIVDNNFGCFASVGFRLGPRTLNLERNGCLSHQIIVHELGHSLGFYHEHSRPDRDEWVTILSENVIPEFLDNFDIQPADTYGVQYDYLSVLHYGRKTFTRNGGDTIITKDATFQNQIGNAPYMSFLDAVLLNKVYPCPQPDGCETVICPNRSYKGKNCQCFCNKSDGVDSVPCDSSTTTTTTTKTTTTSTEPTTTKASTTTTEPTTTKEPCFDISNPLICLLVSRRCSTSSIVARQCRATCRLCTGLVPRVCSDRSELCFLVKLANVFCVFPGFASSCALSCGFCVPEA